MTLMDYAACDMEWYEEARVAVASYRQGQKAREEADAHQARLRAG